MQGPGQNIRPEFANAVDNFWTTHGQVFVKQDDADGDADAGADIDRDGDGARYLAAAPVPPRQTDVMAQNARAARGGLPEAGLGPVTPASRAGMTPEAYVASQGEVRHDPRYDTALDPAYQGAAQLGAALIAPPVVSGARFANEPSIPNATQFGVDAITAAAPALKGAQVAKGIGATLAAGTAAATAADIASPDAAEAREKRRRVVEQKRAEAQSAAAAPPQRAEQGTYADDPTIKALDEQIATMRRQINDGTIPRSSRVETARQIPDLITKRAARVQELSQGELPLKRAYPNLYSMLPIIQIAGPAAAGFSTKIIADAQAGMRGLRTMSNVRAAENAFADGDIANAAHFADRVKNVESIGGTVWQNSLPIAAGASVGAGAQLAPYLYDARNAPAGSAERKEAERMLEPSNAFALGARGAAAGAIEGFSGAHFSPTYQSDSAKRRAESVQRMINGELQPTYEKASNAFANSQAANGRAKAALPVNRPSEISQPSPAITQGHITSHMMSHPGKPAGAVTWNPKTGQYHDARGRFLPYE